MFLLGLQVASALEPSIFSLQLHIAIADLH